MSTMINIGGMCGGRVSNKNASDSSHKNGVNSSIDCLFLRTGSRLPSLDGYGACRGVYVDEYYNFDLVIEGR